MEIKCLDTRPLLPSRPNGRPNSASIGQRVRRGSSTVRFQRPPSSPGSVGTRSALDSQNSDGKQLPVRRRTKPLTLAQTLGRPAKANMSGSASRGLRYVPKVKTKAKLPSPSSAGSASGSTSSEMSARRLQRPHSAPVQGRRVAYGRLDSRGLQGNAAPNGIQIPQGSPQIVDSNQKVPRRPHSAHPGGRWANTPRIETIFEKGRMRPKSAQSGSVQSSRASNACRPHPRSADMVRHSPWLGRANSQASSDRDGSNSPRRVRPQSAHARSMHSEADSDMVPTRAPRPHSAHAPSRTSRDGRVNAAPYRSKSEIDHLLAQFDIQRCAHTSDEEQQILGIGRQALATPSEMSDIATSVKVSEESKASTPQHTPRPSDSVNRSQGDSCCASHVQLPSQPDECDVGDAFQSVDPVSCFHGFHVRGPVRKRLTRNSRQNPNGDRLLLGPPWDIQADRMWFGKCPGVMDPAKPKCKDTTKRWPRGGRTGWMGQHRHCPVAQGRGTGKDRQEQLTERSDHHFHATSSAIGVVGSTTLPKTMMCLGQPTLAENLAILQEAFKDSAVASTLIMKQDVEDLADT